LTHSTSAGHQRGHILRFGRQVDDGMRGGIANHVLSIAVGSRAGAWPLFDQRVHPANQFFGERRPCGGPLLDAQQGIPVISHLAHIAFAPAHLRVAGADHRLGLGKR